jgi:hypothetical protein
MEKKILEFCRLLRRYGLVISFSQVIDALKAIAEIGFDDDEDFYYSLRSILVIQQEDLALFNQLFQIYFRQPQAERKKPKDAKAADSDAAGEANPDPEVEMVESSDGIGTGEGEQLPPGPPAKLLVKAVREGNYPLMRALADMAVRNLGEIKPEDCRIMNKLVEEAKKNLGWEEVVEALFPARGF